MPAPTTMKLRHLQRDTATALELALAALAPSALIDSLANATGLLSALAELPLDTEPMALWATDAAERATRSLAAWERWEAERRATA